VGQSGRASFLPVACDLASGSSLPPQVSRGQCGNRSRVRPAILKTVGARDHEEVALWGGSPGTRALGALGGQRGGDGQGERRQGVDFPRAGKRRSCSCRGCRVKPKAAALPDDLTTTWLQEERVLGLSIAAFLRLSPLSRLVFPNPDFENLWLVLGLKGSRGAAK